MKNESPCLQLQAETHFSGKRPKNARSSMPVGRPASGGRLLAVVVVTLLVSNKHCSSATSAPMPPGGWPWEYSGFKWFPSWWGPAGRKDGPESASYQPLIARHQVSGCELESEQSLNAFHVKLG